MFGLGLHPAFLIVLFIIVLIVFGPGKLPEVAGAAGRMVREFRKASDDVTGEIRRALDLPEGQGTNLFSAQGLIEQLTREPEASTVTEMTVPMETETETDTTETEGIEQTPWTPQTEELDPDPVGAVGTFGPPEIDAGVYAPVNDGSPVEGNPFEEPMPAGHHEPSSAVMAPSEELSAVDQELARDPDPVDDVEEASQPAMEASAALEPEPAGEVTEAPAPSATVEEPGTSPEEASTQPPAAVNDPTEPEKVGGEKMGEGTA